MARRGMLLAMGLLACTGQISGLDAGGGSAGGGAAAGGGPATGGGAAAGGGTATGGGAATGGGTATGGGGVAAADAGAGCPADAVLCEGFEGPLDPARWRFNGDPATFSIDTTAPREGRSSLHVAYGLPYGRTGAQSIELKPALAAPDDRVYLRTYMRFKDLTLPGAHPYFIDVVDSALTELGFGTRINDFTLLAYAPQGLDSLRIWYEGGGGYHASNEDGDNTPNTENSVTAQTWFCLEMMFFGDHQFPGDTQHPNEEVKVWINGVLIPEMGVTDAVWQQDLGHPPPEHWSPVYAGATWRFGVESFGPINKSMDFWFDGLVLAPTRVGCLP